MLKYQACSNYLYILTAQDTDIDVRASMNTEGGDTAISIPTQRSQLMMSMSSMGGESLQDVWKMLDEARPSPTPRLSSPGAMQRAARFQGNFCFTLRLFVDECTILLNPK